MRLVCYPTSRDHPRIVTAPMRRAWMDQTPDRFAYRCLPLNIANAHGWLILNELPFIASWSGGSGIDSVSIRPCGVGAPLLARSHFGSGVLTFGVNALFRTEPGYDLMVTGPSNQPKDCIQPLTGIVEADWAPFTFTMNWKFTRTGSAIAFERNEAFCMIFPVKRGLVEEVDPEIRSMDADEGVRDAYRTFAQGRAEFNADLRVPGSKARVQEWQKDYFRGAATSLGPAAVDHRTRLRLKDFKSTS